MHQVKSIDAINEGWPGHVKQVGVPACRNSQHPKTTKEPQKLIWVRTGQPAGISNNLVGDIVIVSAHRA
jgi:hypothetical protein